MGVRFMKIEYYQLKYVSLGLKLMDEKTILFLAFQYITSQKCSATSISHSSTFRMLSFSYYICNEGMPLFARLLSYNPSHVYKDNHFIICSGISNLMSPLCFQSCFLVLYPYCFLLPISTDFQYFTISLSIQSTIH